MLESAIRHEKFFLWGDLMIKSVLNKNAFNISIVVLLAISIVFSMVIYGKLNQAGNENRELRARMEKYQAILENVLDENKTTAASLKDSVTRLNDEVAGYFADVRINEEETPLAGIEEKTAGTDEAVSPRPKPEVKPESKPGPIPEPGTEPTAGTVPEPVAEPTETAAVKAGDTVVVTVSAPEVTDMYGYQFNLNFDQDLLNYTGSLKSDIPDLSTIFGKKLDGYVLVGSTMIGDRKGISEKNVVVCEILLTALGDCSLDGITINGVNIVRSDMDYVEGVKGWNCSAMVRKA